MARLGSIAVAGYFPAPPEVVQHALALIELGPGEHAILDPCAGEGAAMLARNLRKQPGHSRATGLDVLEDAGHMQAYYDLCVAMFPENPTPSGSDPDP